MKVQCKNCLPKEGIEIPDFNQSEKIKLLELNTQSPGYSIKYAIDKHGLGLRDAKYIAIHINKTYGHCNRCAFI